MEIETIATVVKLKSTARARRKTVPAPEAPAPEDLKNRIVASIEDDKGEEIVVIPLQGKSALADFMIIASGRSTRQVASMADHIAAFVHKAGMKTPRIEGKTEANWIVVDAGDVIVHLFRPEVRAFYNLEKMWLSDGGGDAEAPTKPKKR